MALKKMPPMASQAQTVAKEKNKTYCNNNELSGKCQLSTGSEKSRINLDALTPHVNTLHYLAKEAGAGHLIFTSYGENPSSGVKIKSKIAHFKPGEVDESLAWIVKHSVDDHRNFYISPSLLQPNVPVGSRGGKDDILAVLGLVADFDDDKAAEWPDRIPITPSYVLETSPGRFQAGFLFKRPLSPEEAKPIAERLTVYCGCDHCTKDLAHVWRIAGTLNWPNKKKLDAGRSPEPWGVRHAEL